MAVGTSGMRIFTSITALALLTLPTLGHTLSAQASAETCADLFVAREYERASIKCQIEADVGTTQSELFLGMLYQMGEGVPASAFDAIKYLERAAEKGNAYAAYRLALVYYDGTLMSPDYPRSREWLEKAIEGENPLAMDLLGIMHWVGLGDLPKNPTAAVALFERAANADLAMAMHHLGMMYFTGQGVAQDLPAARNWIQKAADKGFEEARDFLASPAGVALVQAKKIDAGKQPVSVSSEQINTLYKELHEKPLEESAAVAAVLESAIYDLPSYFIYELARRKGYASPEDGLAWFWVGAIRLRYDALRCKDPSAWNGLRLVSQVVQDTLGDDLKTDMPFQTEITEAAYQLESKFPLDTSPVWACMHGAEITNKNMQAQLEGKELQIDANELIKPRKEWPAIHDEVLQIVRTSLQKKPATGKK